MNETEAVNFVVQRVLDDMVADGHEIGVQVAAYLGDKSIVDTWAGLADVQRKRPVDGDTLFNEALEQDTRFLECGEPRLFQHRT